MTTLRSLLVCSAIFISAIGFAADEGQPGSADKDAAASTAEMRRKLDRIVIPKLEFHDATLREAVDFLNKKSVVMDTESPVGDRGVNIVFKLEESGGTAPGSAPQAAPPASVGNAAEARITVSLANIPLIEALKYVTGLANLKFKVEPDAVSIVPPNAPTGSLITKEWKIPPDLIPHTAVAADAPKEGMEITDRETARNWLIANGVKFDGAASAIYVVKSSRLIVHNTEDQLDLVETIINGSGNGPVLIDIECEFVAIQQGDLKEWRIDSFLGPSNVSGGDVRSAAVADPITDGEIRRRIRAIGANLSEQLSFPEPNASVITDPQFQIVMRALRQKKGVDLLSVPETTVKSGQRAVIEIFRDFRDPTEDTPPQIAQASKSPAAVGHSSAGDETTSNGSSSAVPTTLSFENRNLGVTLEVEAVVGPDGYTIDLNLTPQVVEFEGFISHGIPFTRTVTNLITGVSQQNIISPNVITRPIFSSRKVASNVSVFDSSTVVLGDLLREEPPKVADKAAILGDMPIIDRLFQSNLAQHPKRNLVIFVTARLRNVGSEPVRAYDDKEEVIETIVPPEIAPPIPK